VNNHPNPDQSIGPKTPSSIPPAKRDDFQPIRHWQQK
jgi:hypothetical protein